MGCSINANRELFNQNSNVKEINLNNRPNKDFKNFLKEFKESYYEKCNAYSTPIAEISVFRMLFFPILENNSDNYIDRMIRKKSYYSKNMDDTEFGEEYISHVVEYIDENNKINEKVLTFQLRTNSYGNE
tara:strand:- start:180 stop:569 length:390 start_codon:yes stop_codon:yes gene_type:complete